MKGIRITSIKFKLIIYFSILILVSSIAIGLISIQRASNILTYQAEDSIALLAEDAAKLVESRVETQQKTLEMIALRDDIETMDWTIQQSVLQEQLQNTDFLDMAVVYPNGDALYSAGTVNQLGDRDYVKKAMAGEANVSDLIMSRVTNQIVLMYAAPIKNNGEVVGALVGRYNGNTLSLLTEDTGFGEKGYGYMINKSGTVVAHPETDKVFNEFNPIESLEGDVTLTSIAELFAKAIEEKSGFSDYSYEGNDLYAGYAPVEGSDWIFIITAFQDELLSGISELQKIIVGIVLTVFAVSIIFVYIIGNSITKPIILAVNDSKRIASLDLTKDINAKYLKKKDETGDLAKSLQVIIDTLKDTITEISSTSSQVLIASEELASASQQSASAAAEISQTIDEIARGASDQAEKTQQGSINANELGKLVEDNLLYMKNLNMQSNRVLEVVQEGLTEIDDLYKITEENNQASLEVKDVIVQTNDSSIRIGQASNVISSIAQQTNLLALNAAIEAARAGSAGKGFAVVAEEIKNLALQSSQSTKEIDEVVSELQLNAQNAVKTIERGLEITEEQTKSVNRNRDKYLLIDKSMQETKDTVNQLNNSSEEMGNTTEHILASMESLSAIAEENSASTEEASASIQADAASAEEISATSEGLTTLAKGLQSLIQKFTI